jgi:UDP-GlcNAc:undecaprenyl-phosphate GlcNAc-1-phosphate transferase
MSANFVSAVIGFFVCCFLTPVVRSISIRKGWYDMPGELKIHAAPIPRLGGIALMAGIFASILFSPFQSREVAAVVTILAVVWAIGLLDDMKSTSPFLRLAVDFGCGAAFWFLGLRLQWFTNPFLDFAATVLFLAFVINSMNMLDGVDGLALTVSGIASVGFIVLFLGAPVGFSSLLAWSLAAVCAAMFIYNRPPARIFIGDSGSTLLGAVLAFLALDWVRVDSSNHSIWIPLVFVALPLADSFAAVIRRLRGRRSPFVGDRRHFYDLLLDRGWNIGQVLAVSAITTLVLVVLSLAGAGDRLGYWIPLLGCLALCGFVGSYLGSFDPKPPAVQDTIPSGQLGQRLNEE